MFSLLSFSSLKEAGLSGQIKQVQQICYKANKKQGVIVKGKSHLEYSHGSPNFIVNYNEQGEKINAEIFALDGKYINTYNDRFLPIQTLHYSRDGSLLTKSNSTYNQQGMHLTTVVRNANGSLCYRVEDTLNDKGHIVQHIQFSGDEERVIRKTLHTYNEQGKHLSIIDYGEDESIKTQRLYKYNEAGNPTEETFEYSDKAMAAYNSKNIQKYNKEGDCIAHIYFNADGSIRHSYSYEHRYDEQGRCIETTNYNEQGNAFSVTTHQYDPDGNKILPVLAPFVFPKPEGETEEFEYDEHNNWIKRITFYNNVPHRIFIRNIVYCNEENTDKTIIELLNNIYMENTEDNKQNKELSAQELQWLAEAVHANDTFPVFRYYALVNKTVPSVLTYTGAYIEALALLEELKEHLDACVVHVYKTNWEGQNKIQRYALSFPTEGYLLYASQISQIDEESFDVPAFITSNIKHPDDGFVYISQFQLLCPTEVSGKRDRIFEAELEEYIEKCRLSKKPEKPTIQMIETNANSFCMVEHPVNDDFEIKDLDINYGYGFEKFHEELMLRFNTQTKGLVLFHGEPGTGKTYYIRHLLREMAVGNKIVIYMPPNMVDHLAEPAFMTFLSNEVKSWSAQGYFCVLLIEDAEPLLARRQQGVRIQGVTNLLNMSDGLLNDMLNLQIICTFNVDLKKLDSALLRPGRLVARKEFKALSELDANLLTQRLGIKYHFDRPATLSEIYALQKNKSTLIHDVEQDRDSSNNLDDL